MRDETKAKIEALAGTKEEETYYGEYFFMKEGATPWAEWCERLSSELYEAENLLFEIIKTKKGGMSLSNKTRRFRKALQEYRQWLEER